MNAVDPSRLRRHHRAVVLLVGTLTAVAVLARRQPVSWDEAVTVAVATRPVHAIVGTLGHSDAVVGCYYLLMHGWRWFLLTLDIRPTESWWRLPSAVAAVTTCVLVAAIARRHGGPAAGLWAGTLLAAFPLFAFYAADARPYTLAALTTTSAWAVWTRAGAARRPVAGAAVVVLLLVTAAWLQLFTVLVWPAFWIVANRRRRARAVLLLGLAGCGIAPLLVIALHQSSEIAWIPPAGVATVASVVVHIGGGIAVLVPLLVLAGFALRGRPIRGDRTRLALLWWTCAPTAVLAALDVVRPVLVARYALVSLPMVAVVVGVVVARAAAVRPGFAVRVLGTAILVAAVVTSVLQGLHPWKYEDYRGAAAFALRNAPTGTPVLFAPSSARIGFDVYARPGSLRDVALPSGAATDPLAIAEEPLPLLHEQVAGVCRVVLVGDAVGVGTTQAPAADRAKLDVLDGWLVRAVRGFGAVTVTVLTNPRCTPQPSPEAG